MDRTSSVPMSVLRLFVDKGQGFDPEYCSSPILYYHQIIVVTRVFFVGQLHEGTPIKEHPGNLTIFCHESLKGFILTVTTVWNTVETGDIYSPF